MQYNLKNGIILYYDEPTHTYKVGGKKVPSVTGITSKGLIKEGLTNWKVSFPLGQAKREINQMLKDEKPLDKFSLEKIFADAEGATLKIMKEAGQVGTVVHSLVEDYLKGEKIPDQVDKRVVNCWNLFLAWWEQQEYDPIHIEKKLYSKKHNYAGTLDLIVKDKEKNLVLIDIKTSNQISFDYLLQLNAYRFAYEEETGEKISKALVVRLPKSDKRIDVQKIPLNKKLFNAFLGAKYIMTSMNSYWD
jgi:CRISPR/Cas system-associated exonuclease Cas4 (RecB family)